MTPHFMTCLEHFVVETRFAGVGLSLIQCLHHDDHMLPEVLEGGLPFVWQWDLQQNLECNIHLWGQHTAGRAFRM